MTTYKKLNYALCNVVDKDGQTSLLFLPMDGQIKPIEFIIQYNPITFDYTIQTTDEVLAKAQSGYAYLTTNATNVFTYEYVDQAVTKNTALYASEMIYLMIHDKLLYFKLQDEESNREITVTDVFMVSRDGYFSDTICRLYTNIWAVYVNGSEDENIYYTTFEFCDSKAQQPLCIAPYVCGNTDSSTQCLGPCLKAGEICSVSKNNVYCTPVEKSIFVNYIQRFIIIVCFVIALAFIIGLLVTILVRKKKIKIKNAAANPNQYADKILAQFYASQSS